jgi:hypothetical protein
MSEIIPPVAAPPELRSLDDVDFFEEEEMRGSILAREGGFCFYCLCKLGRDAWVVEHVRSRPEGTNGFRNVVAACRACNNRKGSMAASDFVRKLYREGSLNADEFQDRMAALDKLEAGELLPNVPADLLLPG